MPPNTPPPGLKSAGQALWFATMDDYELTEHESSLLLQLCRTADSLDNLQEILDREGVLNESSQGKRVHPALPELRQQRITYARLIAALGLESGVTDETGPTKQRRAIRGTYGITGVAS